MPPPLFCASLPLNVHCCMTTLLPPPMVRRNRAPPLPSPWPLAPTEANARLDRNLHVLKLTDGLVKQLTAMAPPSLLALFESKVEVCTERFPSEKIAPPEPVVEPPGSLTQLALF